MSTNNFEGKVLTSLGYIQKQIDTQGQHLERIDSILTEGSNKITTIREVGKSAHKRLDLHDKIMIGLGTGVILTVIGAFVTLVI